MLSLKQKLNLKKIFEQDKNRIDQLLETLFSPGCNASTLEKAAYYALSGSGKRFRPCITLSVAKALDNGLDVSYSALAVELFHTASLVADDLPIMDDDSSRRDKPSLHTVYGEDVALLVTYALIGEGYQLTLKNKETLSSSLRDIEKRSELAIANLAQNNGLKGAPSGQLLDLQPLDLDKETLDLIFFRKTVLFFETAFLMGWLFGGGDLNQVKNLKEAAFHFGMAFQIYDDFCDYGQDVSKGKKINYPVFLGKEKSREYLKGHIEKCDLLLQKLKINSESFQVMLELLRSPL